MNTQLSLDRSLDIGEEDQVTKSAFNLDIDEEVPLATKEQTRSEAVRKYVEEGILKILSNTKQFKNPSFSTVIVHVIKSWNRHNAYLPEFGFRLHQITQMRSTLEPEKLRQHVEELYGSYIDEVWSKGMQQRKEINEALVSKTHSMGVSEAVLLKNGAKKVSGKKLPNNEEISGYMSRIRETFYKQIQEKLFASIPRPDIHSSREVGREVCMTSRNIREILTPEDIYVSFCGGQKSVKFTIAMSSSWISTKLAKVALALGKTNSFNTLCTSIQVDIPGCEVYFQTTVEPIKISGGKSFPDYTQA